MPVPKPPHYTHEDLWVACEKATGKKKDSYTAKEQLQGHEIMKRTRRKSDDRNARLETD